MCVTVRQQVGGETLLRRHLVVAVDLGFDVRSGEKLTGFDRHLAHMVVGVQLGGFGRVVVEAEEVQLSLLIVPYARMSYSISTPPKGWPSLSTETCLGNTDSFRLVISSASARKCAASKKF